MISNIRNGDGPVALTGPTKWLWRLWSFYALLDLFWIRVVETVLYGIREMPVDGPELSVPVFVGEIHRLPVIATLRDVQRVVGRSEAGK